MVKRLHIILLPMIMPLRLVFFTFSAPTLLIVVILFNLVESHAITSNNWTLNRVDIQRAKRIVYKTSSKTQQKISLSTKDLNIALNYLLNHYIPSTSLIFVKDKQLHFTFSLLLHRNIFGSFLNFSFDLNKKMGYPAISSLQIGKIKIADEFAGLILESIIKYTPLKEYYILAAQHIKDIKINNRGIIISYTNATDLNFEKLLNLSNNDYTSVIFYQNNISKIVAKHNPKYRLSLTNLFQPLFKLAYQRSTDETAITENRAVLIAINNYVNKEEIQALIPFKVSPTPSTYYPPYLYKRIDMAQHFLISATLAASGAESLANILGVEKEISDAKKGSGFSFIDLAGDRAGLKFGNMAVASSKKARLLQKKMANITHYSDFMPDVRDLPENMNAHVFRQQFKSIYHAKYQKMLKIIDRRISKVQIYQ